MAGCVLAPHALGLAGALALTPASSCQSSMPCSPCGASSTFSDQALCSDLHSRWPSVSPLQPVGECAACPPAKRIRCDGMDDTPRSAYLRSAAPVNQYYPTWEHWPAAAAPHLLATATATMPTLPLPWEVALVSLQGHLPSYPSASCFPPVPSGQEQPCQPGFPAPAGQHSGLLARHQHPRSSSPSPAQSAAWPRPMTQCIALEQHTSCGVKRARGNDMQPHLVQPQQLQVLPGLWPVSHIMLLADLLAATVQPPAIVPTTSLAAPAPSAVLQLRPQPAAARLAPSAPSLPLPPLPAFMTLTHSCRAMPAPAPVPARGSPSASCLGLPALRSVEDSMAGWAASLGLSEPGALRLALHCWRRAQARLRAHAGPGRRRSQPPSMPALHCALACFWIGAKLEAMRRQAPSASAVAALVGLPPSEVASLELQVLALLDWSPYQGYDFEQLDDVLVFL